MHKILINTTDRLVKFETCKGWDCYTLNHKSKTNYKNVLDVKCNDIPNFIRKIIDIYQDAYIILILPKNNYNSIITQLVKNNTYQYINELYV